MRRLISTRKLKWFSRYSAIACVLWPCHISRRTSLCTSLSSTFNASGLHLQLSRTTCTTLASPTLQTYVLPYLDVWIIVYRQRLLFVNRPRSRRDVQDRDVHRCSSILASITLTIDTRHSALRSLRSDLPLPTGSSFHAVNRHPHLKGPRPLSRTTMHGRHRRCAVLLLVHEGHTMCGRMQEAISR